jgi:hypothetical protein
MTALPFLLISLKCQSIARNRQPSFLTSFLILHFKIDTPPFFTPSQWTQFKMISFGVKYLPALVMGGQHHQEGLHVYNYVAGTDSLSSL